MIRGRVTINMTSEELNDLLVEAIRDNYNLRNYIIMVPRLAALTIEAIPKERPSNKLPPVFTKEESFTHPMVPNNDGDDDDGA